MIFKITKLDKRMNGYGFYSHKVEFVGARPLALESLQDLRVWMWDNYGPGCELAISRKKDARWAWDTENNNRRLYVNEEILSILRLKWS